MSVDEMRVALHQGLQPLDELCGEPGEPGRNLVRRLDGTVEDIGGTAQTRLSAGEAITVITPTGGGYGRRGGNDRA